MADTITYTDNTQTDTGENTESKTGGFNWGGVTGLLGVLGTTAVGLFGNSATAQTNTNNKTPVIYNNPNYKKSNSTLIIGLSVGFIILITVMYFVFKSKKGK